MSYSKDSFDSEVLLGKVTGGNGTPQPPNCGVERVVKMDHKCLVNGAEEPENSPLCLVTTEICDVGVA